MGPKEGFRMWHTHLILYLQFTIALEERKRVVSKLYSAKVRHIFAGHYHRNKLGKYQDLEMVTSSAIGWQNNLDGPPTDKPGYRVVQVSKQSIKHEYVDIGGKSQAFGFGGTGFWILLFILVLSASVYVPNLFWFAN